MTLKNGFGKCLLFVYQPMDEKIKTWPLRFPAKENPDMEYRLIPRKFSGMRHDCWRVFILRSHENRSIG